MAVRVIGPRAVEVGDGVRVTTDIYADGAFVAMLGGVVEDERLESRPVQEAMRVAQRVGDAVERGDAVCMDRLGLDEAARALIDAARED